MKHLLDILNTINKKRINPNVRTLNAALRMMKKNDEDIAFRLIMDFKRMNIKFSLASYYYIIIISTKNSNYSLLMIFFQFYLFTIVNYIPLLQVKMRKLLS